MQNERDKLKKKTIKNKKAQDSRVHMCFSFPVLPEDKQFQIKKGSNPEWSNKIFKGARMIKTTLHTLSDQKAL